MDKITAENVYSLIENLDVPVGLYEHSKKVLKEQIDSLYHPDVIAFPLSEDAEAIIEWMSDYHHDQDGKLLWQSIHRYGAYFYNIRYEREIYNVVLINND